LRDGFRTIVLIDGEFHGQPSVWQREIVDAIAEGATVHGASSMGALRAAELHRFGMVGHGQIFEWYRDGLIDADDEVALIYGPEALGYRPLSEPLVNIRATLAKAVPVVISPDEHDQLIAFSRTCYFPERSLDRLLDDGPSLSWAGARRAALADFLTHSRIDLKRCDAIAALCAVGRQSHRRETPPIAALDGATWCRERVMAEGYASDINAIDVAAVAAQSGITAIELDELRRELSEISFCTIWARMRGIAVTADDFEAARQGLTPSVDLSPIRVDQLLGDRAAAISAVRAFARGAAADQRAVRRAVIIEWAKMVGVEDDAPSGRDLVDWIVDAGPNHFGYEWRSGVELIQALRLRGRIPVPRTEPRS